MFSFLLFFLNAVKQKKDIQADRARQILRERERERDRQRERQRETDKQRETERQTQRDVERQTERKAGRQRYKDRMNESKKEIDGKDNNVEKDMPVGIARGAIIRYIICIKC